MNNMSNQTKMEKLFEIVTVLLKDAGQTTEINGRPYKMYELKGVRLCLGRHANRLIHFDDDHVVSQNRLGSINFFVPSSDSWDLKTSELFNNYIDVTLEEVQTIKDVFIF